MGVRKSVNFNVSQETYDKVKEIFPEVIGTEDNLLLLVNAYKFWEQHKNDAPGADAAAYEQKIADLVQHHGEILAEKDSEIARLQGEINNLLTASEQATLEAGEQDKEYQSLSQRLQDALNEREQMSELIQRLTADGEMKWENIRKSLQPFVVRMLEETAKRLSVAYNREIAPMDVLTDMFLRYTIQRNAEWFYPFVLRDADILKIAQEINPDVKSINQIKKSLNMD